jgi:hypothetical protein
MRNSTRDLSLETASGVAQFSQTLARGTMPTADLRNIEVYVSGVDAGTSLLAAGRTCVIRERYIFKTLGESPGAILFCGIFLAFSVNREKSLEHADLMRFRTLILGLL